MSRINEFKGSIKLSGGLVPNTLEFPLIRAQDVMVKEDGTRLSDIKTASSLNEGYMSKDDKKKIDKISLKLIEDISLVISKYVTNTEDDSGPLIQLTADYSEIATDAGRADYAKWCEGDTSGKTINERFNDLEGSDYECIIESVKLNYNDINSYFISRSVDPGRYEAIIRSATNNLCLTFNVYFDGDNTSYDSVNINGNELFVFKITHYGYIDLSYYNNTDNKKEMNDVTISLYKKG